MTKQTKLQPWLPIAIETSTRRGGIAVRFREEIREALLDPGAAHARSLLPALDALLRDCGARAEEIDFVAVGIGPGSYTGLRVGIATALTLAQAAKAPLAGISSFAAIAADAPQEGLIAVIGNAYGGELYFSLFEKRSKRIEERVAPCSLPAAEAIARIPNEALRIDDGEPRPGTVLRLALARFRERGPDEPSKVRPLYLRPSRAEIVRELKKSTSPPA